VGQPPVFLLRDIPEPERYLCLDGIPHEVDVVFGDAVLLKKAASIGKTAGLVVACSAETYVAELWLAA